MPTVFTKIIKGEISSYKIAENEKFYAFLDIFPMAEGHTLIVPKQEIDYLFDLDDTLLSEMIVFAKKVARAIEKSIACKRVGIMVVGLEVPHAHIHLIPIQREGDMNLSNPKLQLPKEKMEDIAQKIRDAFS